MAFIKISRNLRNEISDRWTSVGLWTWIVIFLSVSNSQCLSNTGKCLGFIDTVVTEPQGSIDILYGNPLDILCSAWNYTAEDLQFTVGDEVIPSSKVNDTTIRLFIERPKVQHKVYYCTNLRTNKHCINNVLVETEPKNVINFTCLSTNLDSLNCTWRSPHSYANVSYFIHFTVNGRDQKSVPGLRVPRSGTTSSTWFSYWNVSTDPPYRRELSKYEFTLLAVNTFGNITQTYTFDHNSIMKLNRPYNASINSVTPHSAELQWEIDHNIYHLLKGELEYRIVYTIPELSNEPQHVNTSHLTSKKEKRITFYLKNLPYAFMKYRVKMAIKPKLREYDGYWSDDAVFNIQTASELPDRPPLIPAGAFITSTYKNSMNNQKERIIDVFWKQLNRTEENGANFTYKVMYTDKNHTLTLNSNSLNFVKLEGVSTESLSVFVQSSNEKGSSINTSYLYIPSDYEMLEPPTSFTKVAFANGTYELSWNINPAYINDIDNYTLFWCKYNISQSCSNGMDFAVLPPKIKHHVIDLPEDASYQFALSVNRQHQTSGMVWARCDVSEEGIATYEFPVYLKIEDKGTNYIVLRWNLNCKFRDGIIKGFNVTYCALEKEGRDCRSFRKHFYTNDSTAEIMNITNLQPFQKYSFNFYPHFAIGLKDTQEKIEATTEEDIPSEPTNVTVSNVEFNYLQLTWNPPHYKNGIIKNYVIYKDGHSIELKPAPEDESVPIHLSVRGLTGFTNYTFDIKACNSYCSEKNGTVIVRTKIGPPNKLSKPNINGHTISWKAPANADVLGTYQVSRIVDDNQPIIYNVSDLERNFDICDGAENYEKFQVRAVNFDDDPNHGVFVFKGHIVFPPKNAHNIHHEYFGDWSEPHLVPCRRRNIMIVAFIIAAMIVVPLIIYFFIKVYKRYVFKKEIYPALPPGIDPQKENPKYPFGGWTPTTKEDKSAPSDEDLLLPNNKPVTSTPDITQKEENCGASDRTESTEFSNSSQGHYDREPSDNCSNNSLQISVKGDSLEDRQELQDNDNSLSSATETSPETSPYFRDQTMKKGGYVLSVAQPVPPPPPPARSEYVQAIPTTNNIFQPTTSSYVMASFAPPAVSAGLAGYKRPGYYDNGAMIHDKQIKPFMNFPKLGPSSTKCPDPESLPNISSLPPASKESSYIQLQSLDVLPSHKIGVQEPVTKPSATSGYVSPQDMVLHKHLNILSRTHIRDEPNSLDPAMSPDAYCRFSWNTDPSKDNKILAELPSVDISKN